MSDTVGAGPHARPLSEVLNDTVRRLSAHGLHRESPTDAPRITRELLAAVLDRSTASLMRDVQRGEQLSVADSARVERAVTRFLRGMPFAYAVGTAAFRHLTLQVDERVLIPRPETELLVDHVLRLTAHHPGGVAADIGTGSGALALSLAQEGRFDRVIGTDISSDAVDVARDNAERLHTVLRSPIEFRVGADLSPLVGESITMLVSNPPYIDYAEASALPASVRNWEPPTALFAAEQGQARYSALLRGAPDVMARGGWIVMECDSRRASETADIARAAGLYREIQVHDDLAGRPRILVAQFVG